MDIEIKGYESRLIDGKIHIFAIPKDKRLTEIEMPEAFKDMYNENFLKVRQIDSEKEGTFPDLFEISETKYYIPIRTVKS